MPEVQRSMTLNHQAQDEKEKLLHKIYTDIRNPASFSSPWKLYRAARSSGYRDIALSDVKRFLEGQCSYTLHRHFNPRFRRRKVLAQGMGYQCENCENRGTTFLLSVIDVFLHYALLVPLRSKRGEEVHDGLARVFEHMGPPIKFQTDKGKEFYNHCRIVAEKHCPPLLHRARRESADSRAFQPYSERGYKKVHDTRAKFEVH